MLQDALLSRQQLHHGPHRAPVRLPHDRVAGVVRMVSVNEELLVELAAHCRMNIDAHDQDGRVCGCELVPESARLLQLAVVDVMSAGSFSIGGTVETTRAGSWGSAVVICSSSVA